MYKSVINDRDSSAKGIVDQIVPQAMAPTSASSTGDSDLEMPRKEALTCHVAVGLNDYQYYGSKFLT